MHSHLSGNVAQNHMPIFKLHTERRIGEVFDHLALHLNDIVFGHKDQLPSDVLKFAFFSSDSYCCDIM